MYASFIFCLIVKEMFEEIQENSSQHSDERGDPEGEGVALLSAD